MSNKRPRVCPPPDAFTFNTEVRTKYIRAKQGVFNTARDRHRAWRQISDEAWSGLSFEEQRAWRELEDSYRDVYDDKRGFIRSGNPRPPVRPIDEFVVPDKPEAFQEELRELVEAVLREKPGSVGEFISRVRNLDLSRR